jgi:hypothetical protein
MLLLSSLVLLVWAPSAYAYLDLQATPVTPLNGGLYTPPTSPSILFEFSTTNSVLPGNSVWVEVSRESTLGQDGTLANDKRIAYGLLIQRDSDPSHWYTGVAASWSVGAYYFQYSATLNDYDYGPSTKCPGQQAPTSCLYASPVFSFTIQNPQPQPQPQPQPSDGSGSTPVEHLTMATGKSRALRYARRHFHARNPTARCERVDPSDVLCHVRWLRAGRRHHKDIEAYKESGVIYVHVT